MYNYLMSVNFNLKFVLEVFLGYLAVQVITALAITAMIKIGVEPEDVSFLSLPVFDRVVDEVVQSVLLAPLQEEIIFRGLTSLLFGWFGVIFGTVVWAAAHLPSRISSFSTYSSSIQKKAAAILFGIYAVYGVYFSWLWLAGAGLIAVFMHLLNNAVAIYHKYRFLNKKETDLFEEVPAPVSDDDIWIDSNPPEEPISLRELDPKHFKVLVKDEKIHVEEVGEEHRPTAMSSRSTKRQENKVLRSIAETRLNLHFIDRYVDEGFEE